VVIAIPHDKNEGIATLQLYKRLAVYTIETYRTWFLGHNSCSPSFRHRKLKGITYRDFDHTSFGLLVSYEGWVHAMAGKSSKPASNWGTIEFVNITLTSEQAKSFKTWFKAQAEMVVDLLGQIMVNHYRVSCNWDDNNQCFIATLTGKQDSGVNESKALSARSDDWYEALALVSYKHLVIFEGKAWTGEGTKNNWG